MTNAGGAYNADNSTFTCPASAYYYVYFNMYIKNPRYFDCRIEIMKDDTMMIQVSCSDKITMYLVVRRKHCAALDVAKDALSSPATATTIQWSGVVLQIAIDLILCDTQGREQYTIAAVGEHYGMIGQSVLLQCQRGSQIWLKASTSECEVSGNSDYPLSTFGAFILQLAWELMFVLIIKTVSQ